MGMLAIAKAIEKALGVFTAAVRKVLEQELGVMQMPAIILPDGRYMTDSTKMIEWFEARHPEH